jgi:hypothetical protein
MIHPHVSRRIGAKGKTALNRIELKRRQPKIKKDGVKPTFLKRLQITEIHVVDSETIPVFSLYRLRAFKRLWIPVERYHSDPGSRSEKGFAVATPSEGSVEQFHSCA